MQTHIPVLTTDPPPAALWLGCFSEGLSTHLPQPPPPTTAWQAGAPLPAATAPALVPELPPEPGLWLQNVRHSEKANGLSLTPREPVGGTAATALLFFPDSVQELFACSGENPRHVIGYLPSSSVLFQRKATDTPNWKTTEIKFWPSNWEGL